MRVIRYIKIVVKVNEIVILYLPESYQYNQNEEKRYERLKTSRTAKMEFTGKPGTSLV
jgi:hypothetical protein